MLLAVAPSGCEDGAGALVRPAARRQVGDVLVALGRRFGPTERDAKLAAARLKLLRGALAPSTVYTDTAVWSGVGERARALTVFGTSTDGRYRLAARPGAPPPARPGEARHFVRLEHLGDGVYRWTSHDELALGSGRRRGGSVGLTTPAALDAPAPRAAGSGGLADHARHVGDFFPRTRVALGRLLRLDEARAAAQPDGATAVTARIALADRRWGAFPHLARYLERHVRPVRYRLTVTDAAGATWAEARLRDNAVTLRLRVRDGALVPLDARPRPLPDSLVMRLDLSTKVLIFDIGFRNLIADVLPLREPGAAGVALRFRREPDWQLPRGARQFARAPLRRPFEGEGAMLRYLVRDAGPQLVLERDVRAVVQESAVTRWLAIPWRALLDPITADVHADRERFVGDALAALREDLTALRAWGPVAEK